MTALAVIITLLAALCIVCWRIQHLEVANDNARQALNDATDTVKDLRELVKELNADR